MPLSSVDSAQLGPGSLINGLYRLVRLLGVGGMGEVWEAQHERTKGRVALKLLLPEMGRQQDVLRRFQREVEITSGLNHPNIVRVSDADKLPDGRPFLVMEFLEGHDLTGVSRLRQPLSLAETVEIIEQTAAGLHAAHSHQIIHRDLKPANVFVVPLPGTARLLIKVLDFGISKALDGINKLTRTRNMIGTPNYMAPEQATQGSAVLDARADQFSLAAIAYELLTGHMAFEGDGVMNVLFKVVNEPPPSFASWGIAIPRGVEASVLRGLSKSAVDRFPSVLEFSQDLKRTASALAPITAEHGQKVPAPLSPVRTLVISADAVAPTPAGRTLVIQASPALTTLNGSSGQIDPASRGRRASSGPKIIRVLVGGAGVAIAILVIVVLGRPPKSVAELPTVRTAQPTSWEPAQAPNVIPGSPGVVPAAAGRAARDVERPTPPHPEPPPPPPASVGDVTPAGASEQVEKPKAHPANKLRGGNNRLSSSRQKPAVVKPAGQAGPLNEDL